MCSVCVCVWCMEGLIEGKGFLWKRKGVEKGGWEEHDSNLLYVHDTVNQLKGDLLIVFYECMCAFMNYCVPHLHRCSQSPEEVSNPLELELYCELLGPLKEQQ